MWLNEDEDKMSDGKEESYRSDAKFNYFKKFFE